MSENLGFLKNLNFMAFKKDAFCLGLLFCLNIYEIR